MFVHYRTQGFIFKKIDRGEADQIFTAYTKDFGKLNFSARAARKINSKLRGGLVLFTISEIEFIQGKTFKIATDAVCLEEFSRIPQSLTKLKIAYKIGEVLDNLIKEEEENKAVWQLIKLTFRELNDCRLLSRGNKNRQTSFSARCLLIYYYFFWNLVSLLGYQPELKDCSICGKKINVDLFKILKIILNKDRRTLSRLKIEPFHLKLLKNISEWYNIYITGI